MFGRVERHPAVLQFLQLLEADPELHKTPLGTVARRLGVSMSHLQHLVRRDLGATCRQLIRSKCVERLSRSLHEHPDQTISEIAYQHGYEPQTMYRYFTAVLGASPSEIRREGILPRRN
ncbi:MAG TPA: helix-turn-helix domain-containing protein [Terriglobia bacterium]|nr:helix-turn-helix domain-containing protein [Terriglobia bacterium]